MFFWLYLLQVYACVCKCINIQYFHVCAYNEACKIWYLGLTTEKRVVRSCGELG